MNRVVAGDYNNCGISNTFGIVSIVKGFKINIRLDSESLESFEEVDMTEKRSAGKTIAGGVLFGGIGALLGATSKKRTHTCKIVFKDGKKSLIELDDDTFKVLQREMF